MTERSEERQHPTSLYGAPGIPATVSIARGRSQNQSGSCGDVSLRRIEEATGVPRQQRAPMSRALRWPVFR